MAYTSVTYTFSNGTTADATQVNQNFTDIINGLSDGTKDISINAGTLAGTLTANGNVNLGNATSDDLTVTASLASNLIPKTNQTYDVGSADIGLRALYLGVSSAGALTTKLMAHPTTAGDISLYLPVAAGTAGQLLTSDGTYMVWSNLYKGDSSGNSVAAGYVGEIINGTIQNSGASFSTNTLKNVCSISLTAGIWLVYGDPIIANSGLTSTALLVSISSSSSAHQNEKRFALPGGADYYPQIFRVIIVGTTTTYYLNETLVFSAGSATNSSSTTMSAIRIA